HASIKVNGVEANTEILPATYAVLKRLWKSGDRIELDFPMPVRLVESHPLVEENRNQIAVHRGPIVYCLESTDLPKGVAVMSSLIVSTEQFEPVSVAELPGVVALQTVVSYRPSDNRPSDTWQGELYRERDRKPLEKVQAKLVPYYAWGNRGSSEMSVWIPVQ
ncbi:MAG: glycoside hydrolase family 127 protein, partial [Pirellula sp.]